MILLRQLRLEHAGSSSIVSFGIAETEEEKREMWRLRFSVYSAKRYIDPERFRNGMETDEYDNLPGTHYFIAKKGTQIIGTARLITGDPLPTERIYSFKKPEQMTALKPEEKGEIGRLIIVPPDRENGGFFPRRLILLMLMDCLLSFATERGIRGGYSFIKQGLKKKLLALKIPVHFISDFRCHYPQNGVLSPYFSQPDDAVEPAYYLTDEFSRYAERVLRHANIFRQEGKLFVLKSNFYNRLLSAFGLM